MDSFDKQQTDAEISKALGKRVRQLRQSRSERITQEELAEKADISVSFLSMIERGERAPHIDTLARLAKALGVSVSELFLFAEDEPKSLDPMLKPIAEFARSNSLTRRDIEKLLGVARAMFNG